MAQQMSLGFFLGGGNLLKKNLPNLFWGSEGKCVFELTWGFSVGKQKPVLPKSTCTDIHIVLYYKLFIYPVIVAMMLFSSSCCR